MDMAQPSWRGRSISTRKDSRGKYMAMVGGEAILYIPISVAQNAVYKITLEMAKKSGNGLIYCNIYGNKNYDFPHAKFLCDSNDWSSYTLELRTGSFPKTVPMIFRIWRSPNGTGSVLVRKIRVELTSSDTQNELLPEIPDVIKGLTPVVKEKVASVEKPKIIKPPKSVSRAKKRRKTQRTESPNKFVKDYNPNGDVKVLFLRYTTNEKTQESLAEAFADNNFFVRALCFNRLLGSVGHARLQEFIQEQAKQFEPDWIHMQLQFFESMVAPATVWGLKKALPDAIITNTTVDIRDYAVPYFVNIGKHIHRPLICSEGQLEMYRNAGCPNVDYWQVGVNPKNFYRMSDSAREKLHAKYGHDIVFCANRSSMEFPGTKLRERVVKKLSRAYGDKFGLYGCWRGLSSKYLAYPKQNEVYNSAHIVISVNNFNDVYKYFSKRQLIAMSSGTLTMSAYVPGLEEYFENNKDLVWFHDADECLDLVRYYMTHPKERDEIGKQGARNIAENHSYFKRVEELAVRLGFRKW